jgi:hypothetical protein
VAIRSRRREPSAHPKRRSPRACIALASGWRANSIPNDAALPDRTAPEHHDNDARALRHARQRKEMSISNTISRPSLDTLKAM